MGRLTQVWRVVVGRDVPNAALDVTLVFLGTTVGLLAIEWVAILADITGTGSTDINAVAFGIGMLALLAIVAATEVWFPTTNGRVRLHKMAIPGRAAIAAVVVGIVAIALGVLYARAGLIAALQPLHRPGLDDRLDEWSIKTMTTAWGPLLAVGVLVAVVAVIPLMFAIYGCATVGLMHAVPVATFGSMLLCTVGGLTWIGLLWTVSTAIVGNGGLFVMLCAAFGAGTSAAIGQPIRVVLTGVYGAGARLVSPVLRFRRRRLAQRSGVPRATIRQ